MPRKKLSPFNPSQDEGYSEEIQSDSSLESNSRRNTRRKKPQRKDSSKENRINLLLQSTNKKGEKKAQGNSSEKNEKRPSIIKIFRRIDRKAKNIYMVDDKMEDRNELIIPPEPKCYLNIPDKGKSSCSFESSYHEKSLLSDYTGQISATTVEEHSIRTIKTDYREQNDLGEVDLRNLSSDLDSSYSSATDIDQIYNKTDASNMPRDVDASYYLVTNVYQEPNKAGVQNMHRDDTVIDFDQTPPSGSDVYSQLVSSYSDISNSSEVGDDQTSAAPDVCFQQSSSDFDASVSGSDEILNVSDSSENNGQELNKAGVWNTHRDINALYTSVTDSDQTTSESDVYSQLLSSYSDISNYSEVGDDQTSNAADVCLQQSSRDFDPSFSGSDENPNESDSSENSTAVDVCIQQSISDFDASVTGEDEISNESLRSSLLLSSYLDDSNFLLTDSDYVLSKDEDVAYRQPPSNDLDVSSFLLIGIDSTVEEANELFELFESN